MKIKVTKIGALRERDIPWEGKSRYILTNNFDILGISYNTHYMGNITKLNISPYADDTTAFLNGQVSSLNTLMHLLKQMSGLGINSDNTKVDKIKALRDRDISWEGEFGFEWTNNFDILGISYNSH